MPFIGSFCKLRTIFTYSPRSPLRQAQGDMSVTVGNLLRTDDIRNAPVRAGTQHNRIIATEWDTHKELSFLVTIYLKGIDSMGLLNEVTQVISRQLNVNIRKLTIETTDGIFEGKIQLYVHDVDDVRSICDNLKQIQNIKQVTRIEG